MTATNIHHPKAWPNIAQTSAIVEEINLGLFWKFVPTQEETVVYVVTPKRAIDPRKRVIVFADRIGSYHVEICFTRTMLFLRSKLHAETDVRLILVSLSARPNSLRVWNVDLDKPLEFGCYATARVTFVEGSAARFAVISLH